MDFNFPNTTVALRVYYQCEKKTEFQLVNPAEKLYKFHVVPSSEKLCLSIRLNCLSSQHNDGSFRLLITVASPQSETLLEVLSEPSRVVSKPSQVKKELFKSATSLLTLDTLREQTAQVPYFILLYPLNATVKSAQKKGCFFLHLKHCTLSLSNCRRTIGFRASGASVASGFSMLLKSLKSFHLC